MDMTSYHIRPSGTQNNSLLLSSLGITISILVAGLYYDIPWLGALFPVGLLTLFLVVFHPQWIIIILFALIPLSSELELSNGFSTDIPGEPMLWISTLMATLYLVVNRLPAKLLHPIGYIIALQLIWLVCTTLFADNTILSLKHSIAKIWYILPCFVLPFYILKNRKGLHKLFDAYLIGLLVATLYFFISHAQVEFDFLAKTEIGKPIWRNHVNYACCMAISLPIAIYRCFTCASHYSWYYKAFILTLLVFMYFSYARVVYLCLFAGALYALILYMKLTKLTILVSLIAISGFIYMQIDQSKYVRYAPEYSSTIMQESFDKKIAATLKGKDISTMERLHRWVAGLHMVAQHPITGVGPSNFYASYKKYTVHSFETYVSDNPERSGIHNYYLMIAVEQGVPGLLLLLSLLITSLVYIEKGYHHINSSKATKQLLLLSGTCLIIIISLNSINDMLEVIKIGCMFYFMLFIASTASNPLFLQE